MVRFIICLLCLLMSTNLWFVGFYLDSNIMPCDTYLGISFYVVSCVLFVFLILGYGYMLYSMIHIVVKEFQTSKFVDVLEKLLRIRDEEIFEYKVAYLHTIQFMKF